jgi:hypothetical protein
MIILSPGLIVFMGNCYLKSFNAEAQRRRGAEKLSAAAWLALVLKDRRFLVLSGRQNKFFRPDKNNEICAIQRQGQPMEPAPFGAWGNHAEPAPFGTWANQWNLRHSAPGPTSGTCAIRRQGNQWNLRHSTPGPANGTCAIQRLGQPCG